MVSTKLSADNCMLTYVCHWELMKLVSSHGSSTLLFVMEVMVWHLWTTLIWLQPNSRGFSGEEFTYPGTKMLGTSKSQVSQEFKKKTQQQFCSLCKAPVLELYTHIKCVSFVRVLCLLILSRAFLDSYFFLCACSPIWCEGHGYGINRLFLSSLL